MKWLEAVTDGFERLEVFEALWRQTSLTDKAFLYRRAIEYLDKPAFIHCAGFCMACNDALLGLLGLGLNDVIGHYIIDWMWMADVDTVKGYSEYVNDDIRAARYDCTVAVHGMRLPVSIESYPICYGGMGCRCAVMLPERIWQYLDVLIESSVTLGRESVINE